MTTLARQTRHWSPLSAPVMPAETDTRIRAQSILCGIVYRDGRTSAPPLSLDQARDVLRWNTLQGT